MGCYTVTTASIRHATPANVLVPVKDASMKGIWKWLHVHAPRMWSLERGFFGGGLLNT